MSELWKNQSVSNLVSETVCRLGYSLPMVNLRRKYICYTHSQQPCSQELLMIVTGSKAEGISKPLESDVDFLLSSPDIISTTTDEDSKHLLLDRRDCPPGYTKLSFLRDDFFEDIQLQIPNSIIIYNKKLYLGSTAWKSAINSYYRYLGDETLHVLEKPSGPSNPLICLSLIKADTVLGIICDCPDILQPWIDHSRNFWPPYEVIRDISRMEAYVVPVGHVTSDMQNIEWRICFTRAEHRLIDSFNDCQIKLLVLLKMICKTYLGPLCKEMTSYLMKNVIYWVLEKFPDTFFEGNNLLKAVEFALISLRNFILINNLPNYMIPERNLLADKVEVSERHQLCLQIEALLSDGPRILLDCDKIGSALYMLNSCPRAFFLLTQFQFLTELELYSVLVQNEEIVIHGDMRQILETLSDSRVFLLLLSSLY